ncbi:MAG: DNA polymerase III subunit beta [Candidatus Paceibacterota bacterium]
MSINFDKKFLTEVVKMQKLNSGNIDKRYTGETDLVNSVMKITAGDMKVGFETIQMGNNYTSVLSLYNDNIVDSVGESFVNLDKFEAVLGTLKENSVRVEEGERCNLVISDKKRSGKIPLLACEDKVPQYFPLSDKSSYHVLPAVVLRDMLSKVKYAIAPKDEVRACLRGVCFIIDKEGGVKAVASDGKRMAKTEGKTLGGEREKFEEYVDEKHIDGKLISSENKVKEEVRIILPERTVEKLIKLLEGSVRDCREVKIKTRTEYDKEERGMRGVEFIFSAPGYQGVLFSSVIDGRFPNYEAVIPTVIENRVLVSKKEIVEVLKSQKKFSDKLYKIESSAYENQFEVKLNFKDTEGKEKEVKVLSGHEDFGVVEEVLKGRTENSSGHIDDKRVSLRTEYLLDAVKEVEGEKVELRYNRQELSIFGVGEMYGEGYMGVIMPINEKATSK